ncbi:glycine N-acyltransferase-like protein 3 [Rhinatrema bivittatum]|uniref:glycine N-acyltransferase-like protein 3 n=1 Tax=Rhinatrema bivittatum TaxID=194408 RepID=UPI00112B235E|nr:glycine N-acyltransferase-like protein 3 [Rhinatrema bivittatum]
MFPVQCPDQLFLLRRQLRQFLPESLKVCGSILSILRGNPFQMEVLVDSWPDFTAVLSRPQKDVGHQSDTYRNSYVYFVKDPSRTPESLIEAMDWTQPFEVQGLQNFLLTSLIEAASHRNVRTETAQLLTFHLKEGNPSLFRPRGDQRYRISSLSLSQADLLNKTWAYGGNRNSLDYVAMCIQSSPSCCLFDSSGSPISWALTDQYGAIRMAYTLPDLRGKGYGKCVISTLANELQQADFPNYCHVEISNEPSKALFKSVGFVETACSLLWFHSIPATS